MENKLQKILIKHKESMCHYQQGVEKYMMQIRLYNEQKLDEEVRITRVKYEASYMITLSYKTMCDEIEELFNEKTNF